jgi:hypothetical protein
MTRQQASVFSCMKALATRPEVLFSKRDAELARSMRKPPLDIEEFYRD